jgi:c-di-GMP-binding flagellar brake protein YcgR
MQRRKDRRVKQWNKTLIRFAGPTGPAEIEAYTSDISLGGARLHSPQPFEVGTLLQLRIELVRTREAINIEGLVKWAVRHEGDAIHELGVEFQHSASNAFMSLMKNIHDIEPRPKIQPPPVDLGKI